MVHASARDVFVVAACCSPALLGNRPASRGSGAAVGNRRVPFSAIGRGFTRHRSADDVGRYSPLTSLGLPRFRLATPIDLCVHPHPAPNALSPFSNETGAGEHARTHRALFTDELFMEIDRVITRRVSLRELRDRRTKGGCHYCHSRH